eukprot:CAMPEP_0115045538 /NCGR_PEP_ID=MMETSP0216-20121206/48206_1 /TAXON_ID=223996 /ORGANISM="Protocruzia adherens, Strain Boccale" /LENGTH=173 /DNA_ID=CAMNT_0002428433 /DNA_START=45 /DNA_END=566 /DNA_ORIENTATION=+
MKTKSEVSLSAFSFLFSEMVQYALSRVKASELESKLQQFGYEVGPKILELATSRSKINKRELKVVGMLQLVSTTIWKGLFNKNADSLERSIDDESQYMIHEKEPVTNKYISTSKESNVSVASYVAGMIEGILHAANFPAECYAHSEKGEKGDYVKTIFVIKFEDWVIRRDGPN